MSDTAASTDHDTIVDWAETRHGRPAVVSDTEDDGQDTAILRISFGQDDEGLTLIEWDEWFRIFDEKNLALLHSTEEGNQFNKLIGR